MNLVTQLGRTLIMMVVAVLVGTATAQQKGTFTENNKEPFLMTSFVKTLAQSYCLHHGQPKLTFKVSLENIFGTSFSKKALIFRVYSKTRRISVSDRLMPKSYRGCTANCDIFVQKDNMVENEGQCFSADIHNSPRLCVYGGSSPNVTKTPFRYFSVACWQW